MLLKQVIKHIQGEVDKLYAEKNSLPSSKLSASRMGLLAILEKVILLLEQSRDGLRIEKIKQALYHLQNVKVDVPVQSWLGLFASEKIMLSGEILKKQNQILPMDQAKNNSKNTSLASEEIILNVCRDIFNEAPSHRAQNTSSSPLSIYEYETLEAIHIALMKCYSRIKWCFVYPSESSEGIDEVISQWQTKQTRLLDSATAAYVDYLRTCIMREVTKNDKEIEVKLNALIQRADAYSPGHDSLLKAWLASNGGQANSRFIISLFKKGYFVPESYDDISPAIGVADDISAPNWYVDKGKICFKFDMAIRTIQYGSMASIITNQCGQTKMLTDLTEIGEALEAAKKSPPTLLRVAGKISLEVCDEKVMPTVKSFTVLSFTDFIKHPTKNNNQELQIDPPRQNNIIKM